MSGFDLAAATLLVRAARAERDAAWGWADPAGRTVAPDRTNQLTDTLAAALIEISGLRAEAASLRLAVDQLGEGAQ